MSEWHGWKRTDGKGPSLNIGPLPGRARIAMWVEDGGLLRPLAYFVIEEHARRAMEVIDAMTGVDAVSDKSKPKS